MTDDDRHELLADVLAAQEQSAGVGYRKLGHTVHVCLADRALCGLDMTAAVPTLHAAGPTCHQCAVRAGQARDWALAQASRLFADGFDVLPGYPVAVPDDRGAPRILHGRVRLQREES